MMIIHWRNYFKYFHYATLDDFFIASSFELFETWTSKNVNINKNENVNKNEIKIEYDGNSSNRFKEIINRLRGNKRINIYDEGIISVTASSTED